MNMCIYPNYRVLGEVAVKEFQQNGEMKKRVSFCISSYRPDTSGLFLKIYCHAFDQVAEDLAKAGLGEGDLITVFAEHVLFKSKNGIESRYKVTSFSHVKKKVEAEEKEPKSRQNDPMDSFVSFLNQTFN